MAVWFLRGEVFSLSAVVKKIVDSEKYFRLSTTELWSIVKTWIV